MKATNVESLFGLMDEAITLLQTEVELTYIEALSETLENLSFEAKAQQVEGLPSIEAVERLNSLYKKMNLDALLMQEGKVVAYVSRQLKIHERNYLIYELVVMILH